MKRETIDERGEEVSVCISKMGTEHWALSAEHYDQCGQIWVNPYKRMNEKMPAFRAPSSASPPLSIQYWLRPKHVYFHFFSRSFAPVILQLVFIHIKAFGLNSLAISLDSMMLRILNGAINWQWMFLLANVTNVDLTIVILSSVHSIAVILHFIGISHHFHFCLYFFLLPVGFG